MIRKHRWMILAAVFIAGGLAILFFLNPAEHALYPVCFFHCVTGWNCPGCGGLRATHQLLHGHVVTAFRLNPLFVVAIPVFLVVALQFVVKQVRGQKMSFRPTWLWIGLAVVLIFGIIRNLPFPPFEWMTRLPQ